MATSGASLEKKLDLLISKGPALREAGYSSVTVGDLTFTLVPAESKLPEDLQAILDDAKEERSDPMGNAATYGLPEGTELPGFSRLIKEKRDAR